MEMCRFAIYLGPRITLDALITRPENSIIHQSFGARERADPLNGDGFGVGWYVPEVSAEPATFRSIAPAWSNENLRQLARVTRSGCVLAHVRAASPGIPVTETNCHPFTHGPLAFVHNGGIGDFMRVKRLLVGMLSDEAYATIRGSTDSELLFGLFRDRLARDRHVDPASRLASALVTTIRDTIRTVRKAGITEPTWLNIGVTDGRHAACSRYGDDPERVPATLYTHTGKLYSCEGGVCHMIAPGQEGGAVLICSEPLSDDDGWTPVPPGSVVAVHANHRLTVRPVEEHAKFTAA